MAKNVPAINTHFEIVFHTAGNFIFIKTKTEAEKIVARMKAEKKKPATLYH